MKSRKLLIKGEEKGKLKKIRSKYILKIIFRHLEEKKELDIIKYNKNLKNKIDININHYKECSQKYSSIEIEIRVDKFGYGKFINIKKEEKKYYHIYFNNKKEEIKRNYTKMNEEIKIIKIIIDYQVESLKKLFYQIVYIEAINFKKFCRNNITDMSSMFSGCISLKKLNLNCFNTNNVTNMYSMFSGCLSLKELNLNSFNTNNVKDMSHMFSYCSSLKIINLNNFYPSFSQYEKSPK